MQSGSYCDSPASAELANALLFYGCSRNDFRGRYRGHGFFWRVFRDFFRTLFLGCRCGLGHEFITRDAAASRRDFDRFLVDILGYHARRRFIIHILLK